MRTCSLCEKAHYARGWCQMHYRRWKNYGDPNMVVHVRGDFGLRMDQYVIKTPTCWIWTGDLRHGYGRVTMNYRAISAHRASWEYHVGPVPDGMILLHTCDNPPCVNPEHLRIGTNQDNTDDMVAKGRASWQSQ